MPNKTEIFFSNPYWSNKLKIEYLQRRIIVHSILYYELDNSILEDYQYDGISRQLIKLMSETSDEEFRKTEYYYCMHDFDGTTGFDLYNRLNDNDKTKLMRIAQNVLDVYMRKKYGKTKKHWVQHNVRKNKKEGEIS